MHTFLQTKTFLFVKKKSVGQILLTNSDLVKKAIYDVPSENFVYKVDLTKSRELIVFEHKNNVFLILYVIDASTKMYSIFQAGDMSETHESTVGF